MSTIVERDRVEARTYLEDDDRVHTDWCVGGCKAELQEARWEGESSWSRLETEEVVGRLEKMFEIYDVTVPEIDVILSLNVWGLLFVINLQSLDQMRVMMGWGWEQ